MSYLFNSGNNKVKQFNAVVQIDGQFHISFSYFRHLLLL